MNNETMVQAQVFHAARERQVMPLGSSSGEGSLLYYAHVVAIVVLYILWRAPIITAKSNKNLPGFVVVKQPIHTRGAVKEKSREESALHAREKAIDDVLMQHDAAIEEQYPNATAEERRRFLSARLGNIEGAKTQLGKYLEWREKHDAIEKELNLPPAKTDEDDWNIAAAVALVSCEEPSHDQRLPRIARVYSVEDSAVMDRDEVRVLHVMPGQINTTKAQASTYAVALALYIDRKLDRASLECLTVALDVRGGRGWPNIPPLKQLPFIQTTVKLLLTMFPERLHRCLLFPVPRAARWIWNVVKAWIDPLTAAKVQLLTGPAKIVSEPPFAAMEEFLEPHVAKFFEEQRHESFLDETSSEEEC